MRLVVPTTLLKKLCTYIWLSCLSRWGFGVPIIIHPSSVFCVNGSFSLAITRGVKAAAQHNREVLVTCWQDVWKVATAVLLSRSGWRTHQRERSHDSLLVVAASVFHDRRFIAVHTLTWYRCIYLICCSFSCQSWVVRLNWFQSKERTTFVKESICENIPLRSFVRVLKYQKNIGSSCSIKKRSMKQWHRCGGIHLHSSWQFY